MSMEYNRPHEKVRVYLVPFIALYQLCVDIEDCCTESKESFTMVNTIDAVSDTSESKVSHHPCGAGLTDSSSIMDNDRERKGRGGRPVNSTISSNTLTLTANLHQNLSRL